MRIGLFYLSWSLPSGDSVAVGGSKKSMLLLPNGGQAFIRVEEVEAPDEASALDLAKPRFGEAFMNSHKLPETNR